MTSDPFRQMPRRTSPADAGVIIDDQDPGAIGPRRYWCTPAGALFVRNATNTGWITIIPGPGGGTFPGPASSLSTLAAWVGFAPGPVAIPDDQLDHELTLDQVVYDPAGWSDGTGLTVPAGYDGLYRVTGAVYIEGPSDPATSGTGTVRSFYGAVLCTASTLTDYKVGANVQPTAVAISLPGGAASLYPSGLVYLAEADTIRLIASCTTNTLDSDDGNVVENYQPGSTVYLQAEWVGPVP